MSLSRPHAPKGALGLLREPDADDSSGNNRLDLSSGDPDPDPDPCGRIPEYRVPAYQDMEYSNATNHRDYKDSL